METQNVCSHAYSWERVAGENTRQRVVVGVGVGGDCGVRVGGRGHTSGRALMGSARDTARASRQTFVTCDRNEANDGTKPTDINPFLFLLPGTSNDFSRRFNSFSSSSGFFLSVSWRLVHMLLIYHTSPPEDKTTVHITGYRTLKSVPFTVFANVLHINIGEVKRQSHLE